MAGAAFGGMIGGMIGSQNCNGGQAAAIGAGAGFLFGNLLHLARKDSTPSSPQTSPAPVGQVSFSYGTGYGCGGSSFGVGFLTPVYAPAHSPPPPVSAQASTPTESPTPQPAISELVPSSASLVMQGPAVNPPPGHPVIEPPQPRTVSAQPSIRAVTPEISMPAIRPLAVDPPMAGYCPTYPHTAVRAANEPWR